jgi:hypothetical protein
MQTSQLSRFSTSSDPSSSDSRAPAHSKRNSRLWSGHYNKKYVRRIRIELPYRVVDVGWENQLQSVWEQNQYRPIKLLNLSSKFEEMVRRNLLCDGSGRGATLAYRITTHYELLAERPYQSTGGK